MLLTKNGFSDVVAIHENYTHYEWVPPERDTDHHSGYFVFFKNPKSLPLDKKKIHVDAQLIQQIEDAKKSDFRSLKGKGQTTLQLGDGQNAIRIGSEFGWSAKLCAWVYKDSITDSYFKAKLNLDALVRVMNKTSTIDSLQLDNYRMLEKVTVEALEAALKLKQVLAKKELNIVTAESLTAGMIAKTLVDIPGAGFTVYGGFVVYDTDAKRKFLDVRTEGVFSHSTASQMALGALEKSRALVALAVTGNAMTAPDDVDNMGGVYVGVALRGQTKTYTQFHNFCQLSGLEKFCNDWKLLHTRKENGSPVYAPFQLTSMIADIVRMKTVKVACDYACEIIEIQTADLLSGMKLRREKWDSLCPPSWILEKHIKPPLDKRQHCSAYSATNIQLDSVS
jgi:PncC family amidohydrolase